MKLIDIYIQEVIRRLPEKMRTDIALELRSTIEDMLPDHYNEEDVKDVLNELGNPAVLASGYKDQPMHLIGPRYFDLYVSLLKMIVPIVALISLITVIVQSVIGYSGEVGVLNVIFENIGAGVRAVIEAGVQVFFWLTLTFAIIERVDKEKDPQPLTPRMEKWTADDLKNITYIPKKKAISKFEVFGGLLWTAIWATFYFNANQLVGIYEQGRNGLDFVLPAFNQEVLLSFWPIIVVIIAVEIAFAFYKLIKKQWTKKMAIFNAVLQIIATAILITILTNSNVINQTFISYMTDLFAMTKTQFSVWTIGTVICFFIVGAVINAYDGFKRASVR